MVSGARKRAKVLDFLLYFIFMQSHTAPCLQLLNSFFSSMLYSPLMHLMLAVKRELFSMFSIKCYIWKSFISKVIDWRPVEIGLWGPIILWKMSAMVGFASQWLSTIDRLIQILCSDCKQWPVSQLYTYRGTTKSSLDRQTHLCSFMSCPLPLPSHSLFVLFCARKVTSLPKTLSVQCTAIRSHHH